MGTSRSPGELSGKLTRLAAEYQDLPYSTVQEASLTTKKIIKGIAPARLRGVGKRGAKLDVAYNIIGKGEESASLIFARGPWQLIERDTSPHRIPKERGARARKRYVVIPGYGVRASANHPGTHGKHPWAKGVDVAKPVVGLLFRSKASLAIRRIF